MKRVLFFIAMLPFVGFSQDVIVFKNGQTIKSKVVEITQTEIKYKRFDNLNGATIVIPKDGVLIINYENGTKENIGTVRNDSRPQTVVVKEKQIVRDTINALNGFQLGDVVIYRRGDNGKFRTGTIIGLNPEYAIIRARLKTFDMPYDKITKKLQ